LLNLGGKRGIASIILVTVVYSISWFNIGALYYLIGPDLQGGVSGLGALTSSFFVGIGLLQIPGGILAARWGPRRVLLGGLLLAFVAELGASAASLLFEVEIFRFVTGAGLAFVFAPSIVIITRLRGGRSGAGAGIVQSSFGVGGLVGLFGWTLIGSVVGWRLSVAFSGILLLLGGIVVTMFIPKDEPRFGLTFGNLTRVLREQRLILVGLSLLSPNMGNILVFSFMPYYLEKYFGEAVAFAALVASAVVVVPIFSAHLGGILYDKTRRLRLLMIATGFAISTSLVLCAAPSIFLIIPGVLLAGLMFGIGPTTGIAAAKDLNPIEKQYDSVAVAWINAISLACSFWSPLVFSYFAISFGYFQAWLGGAVVSLSLLIPMLFLPKRVGPRIQ